MDQGADHGRPGIAADKKTTLMLACAGTQCEWMDDWGARARLGRRQSARVLMRPDQHLSMAITACAERC